MFMGKDGGDLHPLPYIHSSESSGRRHPQLWGLSARERSPFSSLDFSFAEWLQGKSVLQSFLPALKMSDQKDEDVKRRPEQGWPKETGVLTTLVGFAQPLPPHLPTQCLSRCTQGATWPQAPGTGGHPQSPPHGTGWGTCCCPQGWQCPRPRGLEPGMSPVSAAQGRVAPRPWPLPPRCL